LTTSTTNTTPNLSFNASNTGFSVGASVSGSYLQSLLQNKSGTAGASANYVLSNDLGTDSSYYGEFGMNSSVYSSGTPTDFYSINNGIYFSGHDGDITFGSGNGFKSYFAWGSSGQSAHVINASGALGFSTNLGATPALSGTTGYGTAGQVPVSAGSTGAVSWSSTPTLTGTNFTGVPISTAISGLGTGVASALAIAIGSAGAPITFNGALGTPSSGTLTNTTGFPAANLAGTALPAAIVSSSLTSVGTIGTGVWQGSLIGATYGGTGQSTVTIGDLLYGSATNTWSKLGIGATGTILRVVGGVPAWGTDYTGTVTSVSGTGTVSGLTLSGTVTTSGSLTLGGTLAVTPSNFSSQTANTFLAAPNGSAGVPTFRAIVAADIPTLNQNTTGTAANITGTLAISQGGTGATTTTGSGASVLGTSPTIATPLFTGAISANGSTGTSGQVLTSQGPSSPAIWSALSVPAVTALIVAGGGGGGGSGGGGGGGAGGLVYSTSVGVIPQSSYTVTVGAGGAAGQNNGANSSFGGLTAIGGGGGGAQGVTGSNGGSGGGAGMNYISTGPSGGSGTSGQGNGGGGSYGATDNPRACGGGGGAGSAGSGPSPETGGVGLAYSISGSSVYYAGGGGGGDTTIDRSGPGAGAGGNGGGGYGAYSGSPGVNGAANTGGGGGGGRNPSPGPGAGGSGVVIISYPNSYKLATATGTYSQSNTGGNYIFTFTGSGTITF